MPDYDKDHVFYRETVLLLDKRHPAKYKTMAAAVARGYARLRAVAGLSGDQPPLPPGFAKQQCRSGYVRYDRYLAACTPARIVAELCWYATAAGRVRALGHVHVVEHHFGPRPKDEADRGAWRLKSEAMDRGGFNHGTERAMRIVLDVHGTSYQRLAQIGGFTPPGENKATGTTVGVYLHLLYQVLITLPAATVGAFLAGDSAAAARVMARAKKLAAAGGLRAADRAVAYASQIYLARAAEDLASI